MRKFFLTLTTTILAAALSNGQVSQLPGGGVATSAHLSWRALCQNTIGGSNFDSSSSVGTVATIQACDSASGNIDGYVSFANAATQHVQGHVYLPTTFLDPIKTTIVWNTTATTGAAVWGIAAQCVAAGGIPAAAGYGAYTTFASSAAQGTASHHSVTTQLTWTTGCAAGSMLYFDIELTSGNNTLGAAAQLKWLDMQVTW